MRCAHAVSACVVDLDRSNPERYSQSGTQRFPFQLIGKLPMKRVYFDYNATTPVAPEVLAAMLPYFSEEYGNASSIHTFGQAARGAVEQARISVAASAGGAPGGGHVLKRRHGIEQSCHFWSRGGGSGTCQARDYIRGRAQRGLGPLQGTGEARRCGNGSCP